MQLELTIASKKKIIFHLLKVANQQDKNKPKDSNEKHPSWRSLCAFQLKQPIASKKEQDIMFVFLKWQGLKGTNKLKDAIEKRVLWKECVRF